MGYWNAKVGERQVGEEGVMGQEALKCVRNDNGERFVEFCAANSLVIKTMSFPRNQIDHVVVNPCLKRSVFDTKSSEVLISQATIT